MSAKRPGVISRSRFPVLPASLLVVLVALAAALVWMGSGPARRSGSSAPGEAGQQARPGAPLTLAPVESTGDRVDSGGDPTIAEAVPSAPRLVPSDRPFLYRVHGRVRDEEDRPSGGVRILLGPEGAPLNRVAETDPAGCFELAWKARAPMLRLVFVAVAGDRRIGPRRIALESGTDLQIDVALAGPRGPGPIVEGSPRPALFGRGALDRAPSAQVEDGEVTFVLGSRDQVCPRLVPAALVLARLAEREAVRVEAGGVSGIDRVTGQVLWTTELLSDASLRDLAAEVRVSSWAPRPEVLPAPCVRGVVLGAPGIPLAGVRVGWSTEPDGVPSEVRTDSRGEFELDDLPPGTIWLSAGGGDHGVARRSMPLPEGAEVEWSPMLDRGRDVRGRIVDSQGTGIPECRVELWSESPRSVWSDGTFTDSQGGFAVPNVPSGALRLEVTARGVLLPGRVLPGVVGGVDLGDVALAEEQVSPGSLVLDGIDPRAYFRSDSELRAWHLSSVVGLLAPDPDDRSRVTLTGLAPGEYELELVGELGRRDLGRFLVHPQEDVAIEPLAYRVEGRDVPGLLWIDDGGVPEAPARCDLWREVDGLLLRIPFGSPESQTRRALAPGEYVVWTLSRGVESEKAFAVRPGGTTSLRIDARGELHVESEAPDRPVGARADPPAARCDACHDPAGR